MKKLILTGILLLIVLTTVNARQVLSDAPRDIVSTMRTIELLQTMQTMQTKMDKCLMDMKNTDVVVADTPDGVRLTFKPKDPAQLDDLRKTVRAHVEMMQKGECGMHRMSH
jgi:hypothetical protein